MIYRYNTGRQTAIKSLVILYKKLLPYNRKLWRCKTIANLANCPLINHHTFFLPKCIYIYKQCVVTCDEAQQFFCPSFILPKCFLPYGSSTQEYYVIIQTCRLALPVLFVYTVFPHIKAEPFTSFPEFMTQPANK